MKPGSLPRVVLAVTAVVVVAGAGWVTLGSAATLSVAPKSHSAFRTCVLTAYPKTSTVGIDSWVDQSAPGGNKGSTASVQVQSRATKNYRGFIRFDLGKCAPTIAGSATVRTAFLRLRLSAAPTSGTRTYNINRVTGPCPEASITCWTEGGLTWSNQPTVAAGVTSTLSLSSTSTTGVYYAIDVTTDLAAIVAGTASNYGWRISDSAEGNASTNILVSFDSKNVDLAARAPELVIVYSP
jgi:hypothetical protein